jgi:hypothetical protein
MDFYTRRMLYRDALLSFIRTESDLYLLTDMPGNIGEHLICAGTTELLVSGNIRFKDMPVGDAANAARRRGTLLIPGSGAFDRRWHEWLPDAVLAASNNFGRVIILPSSYDVSVPIVARSLSQRNVYPFAREARSYSAIKHLNHAALCFDCATFFNFKAPAKTGSRADDGKAPLLVLREDAGSLLRTGLCAQSKIDTYSPPGKMHDAVLQGGRDNPGEQRISATGFVDIPCPDVSRRQSESVCNTEAMPTLCPITQSGQKSSRQFVANGNAISPEFVQGFTGFFECRMYRLFIVVPGIPAYYQHTQRNIPGQSSKKFLLVAYKREACIHPAAKYHLPLLPAVHGYF